MINTSDGVRRYPIPWAAVTLVGALAGVVGVMLARRYEPGHLLIAAQDIAALRERMAHQAHTARQLDHDLRSPVGAMAVALELLRTTDDLALREEALRVFGRQIARMNTLTQRLHEISREFNG
ncbi:histidine kinase dimerization/phospho-acceptor domain-containing protein [Variovorax sp. LT1R16]|uniref:histidine kinase dimerization/phospho-acceptor domain-containing protein n=1 Tax=Variovorax sp. LT1R16 TaxID=3443728 RepID=UPI003F47FFA4